MAVSGDRVQYCSSPSACKRLKMGAGHWGQRECVREKGGVKVQCCACRDRAKGLHFTLFLLRTVNGKAGPFGTAPKAVYSSSLCLYFIHFAPKC